MAGKALRFLVTAGPTREPIDGVRFISNRSSGRMGYAVARAALDRGHEVVLVTGPVALEPPPGAQVVSVETAAQMNEAVSAHFEACQALVMAAAVADYRPASPSGGKLKKGEGPLVLSLERTADILAGLAPRKGGRVVVGFALEAEDVLDNARRKLASKNLDLIVANDLSAFAGAASTAHLLSPDGSVKSLSDAPKARIAEAIVAWVASRLS